MRDQIGYVLQDATAFRGTVLEDVVFGRPDATREEIVAAAQLVNAYKSISRMPKGYNTHGA
jgi:ABC-type multidrug transport system fused ATPase/permease subunit